MFFLCDTLRHYSNYKLYKEKEKDSFSANIDTTNKEMFRVRFFPKIHKKRTLLDTFKTIKASATIETALVLPLFLFGMMCFIYLFEIMAIQMTVRSGMQEAATQLAQEVAIYNSVSSKNIKNKVVGAIGEERLDKSIIVDGSQGLDFSESIISQSTGIIEMIGKYTVKLPVPRFMDLGISYQERVTFKRWTGYKGGNYLNSAITVYITTTQSVYHTNLNCTHLQLQISMEPAETVEALRNSSGGTYSACERCDPGDLIDLITVYIASTGSAYHNSLECSGLKRTITAVSYEEVIGLGECQRCMG